MRERVTISLTNEILTYVDDCKDEKGTSRSAVIETLLREAQRKAREEDLAAQAAAFFAEPLSADEEAERIDWLAMSRETYQRDAD
jgi:metal-responsive CopG/Arc/MetJ family transcriptional regulator